MVDYRRIGVIPGCSAIWQNLRKPEIQAARNSSRPARQRTRIPWEWRARGPLGDPRDSPAKGIGSRQLSKTTGLKVGAANV
jgi:hypothetical protein